MTLGEVRGLHAPALGAADQQPEVVRGDGGDPQQRLRAPVGRRGGEQQTAGDRDRRQQAADRQAPAVAAGGLGVEHDVHEAHGRVGAGEQRRVAREGPRRGERHQQHRAHRREDREPDGVAVGVDLVGQPRVAVPRPPDDREDQERAQQAVPRGLLGQQLRRPRDREDEHEVEEQLEGRDAALVVPAEVRLRGHPGMMAGAAERDRPRSAQARREQRVDRVVARVHARLHAAGDDGVAGLA